MRNKNLDAGKAIAAYFVILIHVRLPGTAGNIMNALARFAVPYFFMISGYFCYKAQGIPLLKIGEKLRHILYLCAGSYLFYIIWRCLRFRYYGYPVRAWADALMTRAHILDFLKYNNTSVAFHLWFLFALAYCYILFAFVEKLHLHRLAYVLIPVIFLGHLLLAKAFLFTGRSYAGYRLRNWLFTGFPFFMLGHWFHRYEDFLRQRLRLCAALGLMGAGVFLTILEYSKFGLLDLYVGSVPLAFGFFAALTLYPSVRLPELLAQIGRNYSFSIYLFHLAFRELWQDAALLWNIQKTGLYQWAGPFVVGIAVTAFSAVLLRLGRMVRRNAPASAGKS